MDRTLHCADEFDEKSWIPTDDVCTSKSHENITEAISYFRDWLVRATDAISRAHIGVIKIPRTTEQETSVGFACDPTQAYLLIAQVKRTDVFALGNAFYVVLVVQQPTGDWRAVTGFYVPFCSRCETHSQEQVTEWILNGLELPITIKTRDHQNQIPEAIREHEGWFREGFQKRLSSAFQIIGPYPDMANHCWLTKREHKTIHDSQPMLICVGPVGQNQENLFLIPSYATWYDHFIETFNQWGYGAEITREFRIRLGEYSDLVALSGGLRTSNDLKQVQSLRITTGLTRTKVPNLLGVVWVNRLAERNRPQVVRNMRQFIRELNSNTSQKERQIIECWFWPSETGTYNWQDVQHLSDYVYSLYLDG